MKIIKGDILSSTDDIILHLMSCHFKDITGFNKLLLTKFPFIKLDSKIKYKPGNLLIHTNTKDTNTKNTIVTLLSNKLDGKPSINDLDRQRLYWFNRSLNKLSCLLIEDDEVSETESDSDCDDIEYKNELNELREKKEVTVAIPFKIGCNTGGNWKKYLNIITNWEEDNPKIKVTLYKL